MFYEKGKVNKCIQFMFQNIYIHVYKGAFDYVDTIQTNRYVMNVLTCCDTSIVCQALIHSYNTI